jgi:quercetin dioxygenase-like cupin family protein
MLYCCQGTFHKEYCSKEQQMTITRIYADQNGNSHFENQEIPVTPSGPLGWMSSPIAVQSMILRENPPGYHYPWHAAPCRQYIIMLEGLVEIEVGDGEKRTFGPGSIVLVEDTTGVGHASRSPDGNGRRSLFLPL